MDHGVQAGATQVDPRRGHEPGIHAVTKNVANVGGYWNGRRYSVFFLARDNEGRLYSKHPIYTIGDDGEFLDDEDSDFEKMVARFDDDGTESKEALEAYILKALQRAKDEQGCPGE